MNDSIKTLTFVVVALALTGASFVINRDRPVKDIQFGDQGQPFFPEFKDPLACTDLEVVSYDPTTASSARFRVMFKDKKWVIPSHYDYPADARDRLSKTAAAVMDLTKDMIRSDKVDDQKAMGVLDPLDAKAATPEGLGKRVTLRDSSEKVLADFIIGNEIKGPAVAGKEGKTQRYVRVPGQKRTYGVVVNADLSTRFADWIETNLLKVDTNKIRKVVFDNYKMREARSEEGRPWSSRARRQDHGRRARRVRPVDRDPREVRPEDRPGEAHADPRQPGGQRGTAPLAHRGARRPEDRRRPAQAAGSDRPE